MHEQIAQHQIPKRATAARYPVEEDVPDSYYPQRMPSSARRYTTTERNQVIQQGNRRIIIHEEPPPKKRSHWLLFVVIGMVPGATGECLVDEPTAQRHLPIPAHVPG